VITVAKDIKVDIDATKTSTWRIERWLAERVFAWLPWGR
jgi:pantothenate kinase